jgi:HD-GYP domain-containing protein (c-di-GMP phosphodiesterase class II)
VDGAGYPRGLGADDLPLGARILMVCDAFDAMISQRAYRGALPVPEALAELGRCAGTQFDPAVVEALDRLIAADRLPLPFAAGADGLAPALVAAGGARSAGTGR